MTLLGLGLSGIIGESFVGLQRRQAASDRASYSRRADRYPVHRAASSSARIWVVYLSAFCLLPASPMCWVLKTTRTGLIIRAVGEQPPVGPCPGLQRDLACAMPACIAFGGAMLGLRPAAFSQPGPRTPQWIENMTGRRAAGSRWRWWSSPPGCPGGRSHRRVSFSAASPSGILNLLYPAASDCRSRSQYF